LLLKQNYPHELRIVLNTALRGQEDIPAVVIASSIVTHGGANKENCVNRGGDKKSYLFSPTPK
jgi:hypothetical protein